MTTSTPQWKLHDQFVVTESVEGSDVPVTYRLAPTFDALYAPMGLRVPDADGPVPVVVLAYGNGGGGLDWVQDAVRNRGWVMERILERGWACAWIDVRTEVDLGYERGGPLTRDWRSGGELFNRGALDHEDWIATIMALRDLPEIDEDRVALVGISHGGEMILKLAGEYDGVAVAVASEPASHEFLAIRRDRSTTVEQLETTDVDSVLAHVDRDVAAERIARIDLPILVMGRDDDPLQGVFRATHQLLDEAGRDVEWTTWDHPLHGYVAPLRGDDGEYEVDDVQRAAIGQMLDYVADRLG